MDRAAGEPAATEITHEFPWYDVEWIAQVMQTVIKQAQGDGPIQRSQSSVSGVGSAGKSTSLLTLLWIV